MLRKWIGRFIWWAVQDVTQRQKNMSWATSIDQRVYALENENILMRNLLIPVTKPQSLQEIVAKHKSKAKHAKRKSV